jgi:hypothetical protein
MSAMYNMRLPAAESSKLTPARTREPRHTSADVVRAAAAAEQDAAVATAAQRQRAHHLSGFARA